MRRWVVVTSALMLMETSAVVLHQPRFSQQKNLLKFLSCWARPHNGRGVATLDGQTYSLDEEGGGPLLPRPVNDFGPDLTDQPKPFFPPHTCGFDCDGNDDEAGFQRGVFSPLLLLSLFRCSAGSF